MSSQLDAIVGEGTFARPGAPEPSLLPLLARFAPAESLVLAAELAQFNATDPTGRLPVPALERATAAAIAARAKSMKWRDLYEAAACLPRIGALAPLEPVSGMGPELMATIGARLGDETVVRRAILSTYGGDESIRARAAGLPLASNPSELLTDTLAAIAWISVHALGSVAAQLDAEPSHVLLEAWFESGQPATTLVAGVVELLAALSQDSQAQAVGAALELIAEGALDGVDDWRAAYVLRRLREPDHDADDSSTLRDSHPYADVVASGPLLRAEALRALQKVNAMWGSAPVPEGEYRADDSADELFLNARVCELVGGVEVARTDAFARGRRHRVTVHLATKARSTGIVADMAVPIDAAVPHELFVSFFAAWLAPTPPAPILVPSSKAGDSSAASVEFTVPDTLREVALTVVVMERIDTELVPIQSGVIKGDVVEPHAQGSGITLRIDPRPARPAERTTDGVTIVLGDDTLAVYGAAAVDGRFREPGQLKELRASLGDQVLGLWAAIEETNNDTLLAASLVKLAARGSSVLELLTKRLVADDETKHRLFETDATVRLWSRDLDTDLPVEFIYDGGVPNLKEPTLCSGFFDGLHDGACKRCTDRHGAICAFDFWAFRRRIERRVADNDGAAPNQRIAAAVSQAVLSPAVVPAAFGASVKVKPDSRQRVLALLSEPGADVSGPASDWSAWQDLLKDRPHRLLVLLSHNEGGTELEIEGDTIDRQWITEAFVNPTKARPGPVVLLTGCETARPEYAFLSFVSRFLDMGAAVVVGTLALIREDASTEATRQLLLALRDVLAQEGAPELRAAVGEVMRRTRCRLLENRDLLGLNLVAYGDADWCFGSAPVP